MGGASYSRTGGCRDVGGVGGGTGTPLATSRPLGVVGVSLIRASMASDLRRHDGSGSSSGGGTDEVEIEGSAERASGEGWGVIGEEK